MTDFDSPPASSPTDRRDADDATFAAAGAEERGEGICRTCLAPIWNEGGTVGHRKRAEGWSDRIERGGDSLVCFSARDYRHVPLTGREAAIYDRAYARGAAALKPAPGTDEGYHVELGGQRFTQAQWEALQPYIEGRANADSEDAATWTAVDADTTCECDHDRGSHDGLGNCWHMDAAGDADCNCDQFRSPAPDNHTPTNGATR